ncbi:MAG: histidinol-phosphate transaminase [Gammaproteobacteria bacterium]|nr:histidinol-phosphate transaminase [Gammaproteobacteria bacterium]
MSAPVNPNIASLSPYQPGKPIDEAARELGLAQVAKLASNENPRGPAPAVRERIQGAMGELSRYPDANGHALKRRLAIHHDLEPHRITLGNGSNDVLELAAKFTLEPGTEGIMSAHGFIVYKLAIIGCGADLVTVPAKGYGCDLDAMLDRVTDATRIVFIANPNNPTGSSVNERELTAFLDRLPARVWAVLDEAYAEYVDAPDHPDGRKLLERYPNLIVTRTFSKIHALAGLRIGYALSSAQAADLMNRARQPFNVSSLGLAAAEAALDETAFVAESAAANREGLAALEAGLRQLGHPPLPSAGNFLCVDLRRDAQPVFEALLRSGVIVRSIREYGLPNHIRVSVGLSEENQRFLEALGQVL